MIGNKHAAIRGGLIAGSARKNLEKETGKKVITDKNFSSGVDKKELE